MENVIVEILGGEGIDLAFKELGVEAKCTYKNPTVTTYEVWEINKDDVEFLDCVTNWPEKYGWWRYSDGSVIDDPTVEYTINGKKIIAWQNAALIDALNTRWKMLNKKQKASYNYDFENYKKDNLFSEYTDLFAYLSVHMGVSTENNRCATAVDLAKMNNMTMAQLFKNYMG